MKYYTFLKDIFKKYPMVFAAIGILLAVGGSYYLGTLQTYEHTKSTKIVSTAKKATETASKTTTNTYAKVEKSTEQKQTTAATTNSNESTAKNSNYKKTTTKVTIEKNPDGKVVETHETTEETNVEDTNTSKTEGTATNTVVENKEDVKAEDTTAKVEDNTAKTTEETTSTTEIIDTVKKNVGKSDSSLGIAITAKGDPAITYDVIRIGKLAVAAFAEVDYSEKKLGGAGVAITSKLSQNTFIGVGIQQNFSEKKQEVNAMVGVKF